MNFLIMVLGVIFISRYSTADVVITKPLFLEQIRWEGEGRGSIPGRNVVDLGTAAVELSVCLTLTNREIHVVTSEK